jgi:hypothetical protein
MTGSYVSSARACMNPNIAMHDVSQLSDKRWPSHRHSRALDYGGHSISSNGQGLTEWLVLDETTMKDLPDDLPRR